MSIPLYRERALNQIALNALKSLKENIVIGETKAVPIEKIVEQGYNLTIEYVHLTEKGDKLGQMVYSKGYTGVFDFEQDKYVLFGVNAGTILIEADLVDDITQYGRYRFTLAHELGHWLLHKEMFLKTGQAAAMYDEENDEHSIEWQANFVAKAILMPKGLVKKALYEVQSQGIHPRHQIDYMAALFEVSKEAMSYRLKDFGILY